MKKTKNADSAGDQQRGRPFKKGQSGNPAGRPVGARNRATRAMEALLDGEAEDITRKAIELAKGGDGVALRLCLERLLPPRKDRPVTFTLPDIDNAKEAAGASLALLQAVAKGEISPQEAVDVSRLLETCVKAFETADIEERLSALERRQKGAEQ